MATYIIRPVDTTLINQRHSAFLRNGMEMFTAYNFEPDAIASSTLLAGWIHLNNNKYYLVSPHNDGFVVKKVYKENPDEPDHVLRAWGDYNEFNLWHRFDERLDKWLDEQVYEKLHNILNKTHIVYRLRAFSPRRSEQFFGKIALYQSQERRDQDRLTAVKPARAFSMMFPELEHKDIIQMTDLYLQEFAPREFTIHTSKDADKFKFAYSGVQCNTENIDTSPSRKSIACSCMRYDFDSLPNHPAEAYASGDFTIVYATDQNNHVAGRCVVYDNPDQGPQAGPIYGVSEQALDLIQDHLYGLNATLFDSASWVGARLQRIEYDGGFIAPYLDLTPQRLSDTGTHLVVSHYGDIDASQYNGVLGGHHTQCCNCNEGLSEDEYWYSEYTNEHYCESCFYDEHVYCEYYEDTVHQDETTVCYRVDGRGNHQSIQVANQVVWGGDVFVLCSDDEHWYIDDVTYCSYNDSYISPDDIKNYFTSDWDGELYPNSVRCVTTDGDEVAEDELENDSGIWQRNSNGDWEQVQEEMEL